MKLDYVIHHGENGSSSGSSLEINSFEELNKIRFGKYWKKFFGDKVLKQTANVHDIVEKEEMKKGYNILTFSSTLRDIDFYGNFYNEFFFKNELYIPELVGIDFENISGKKEKEDILLNLKNKQLNIFPNEFIYRSSLLGSIYYRYKLNKNITKKKKVKRIIDANYHFNNSEIIKKDEEAWKEYSERYKVEKDIKQLDVKKIDYINDYLEENNYTFDVEDILRNKLKQIKEKDIRGYLDDLSKKDVKNQKVKYNLNGADIDIYKIDNFYPIGFEMYSREAFYVEFDKNNSIYFDQRNVVCLKLDSKVYVYKLEYKNNFVKVIENFDLLKQEIKRFPKYEIMDKEYKLKLKEFIKYQKRLLKVL